MYEEVNRSSGQEADHHDEEGAELDPRVAKALDDYTDAICRYNDLQARGPPPPLPTDVNYEMGGQHSSDAGEITPASSTDTGVSVQTRGSNSLCEEKYEDKSDIDQGDDGRRLSPSWLDMAKPQVGQPHDRSDGTDQPKAGSRHDIDMDELQALGCEDCATSPMWERDQSAARDAAQVSVPRSTRVEASSAETNGSAVAGVGEVEGKSEDGPDGEDGDSTNIALSCGCDMSHAERIAEHKRLLRFLKQEVDESFARVAALSDEIHEARRLERSR